MGEKIKRLMSVTLAAAIAVSLTVHPEVQAAPTFKSSIPYNASDEAALRKIIEEQQERGVEMKEALDLDSRAYTWSVVRDPKKNTAKEKKTDRHQMGFVKVVWGYFSCGTDKVRRIYVSPIAWRLTGVDVSKNKELKSLDIQNCQLTKLDVSKNKKLKGLLCTDNKLTSLDVTKCPELQYLTCAKNRLTSLDLSGCRYIITSSLSYDDNVTIIGVTENNQNTKQIAFLDPAC